MKTRYINSWSYVIRNEETGNEDVVYQTSDGTLYINQYISRDTGLQVYSIDGKIRHLMTQETLDNLIDVLKSKITVVDKVNVVQMIVQPVIKEIKSKKK